MDDDLLDEVFDRLESVQESRDEKGEPTFDIDLSDGILVIRLPQASDAQFVSAEPAAPPAAPAEPAKPAAPATPAEPAVPAEPADPATPAEPATLADDSEIGNLVDAAVGWALGGEYDEVRRALSDAKREVQAETARAMAEAKRETAAALQEAKRETAAAIEESTSRRAIGDAAAPADDTEPGKRPSWVDSPPQQRLDEKGEFVVTGSTGPLYATQQEARSALASVLEEMTQSYVDLMLGPGASSHFDAAEVRRGKSPVIWTGPAIGPSGMTYYEAHAMLRFNDRDHRDLVRHWRGMHNRKQAVTAGVLGGAVLLVLATMLGYLKLDTATRGYYSGRLKLAAGVVALTVATLATLVATGEIRL